jgi:uncharacterized protein
MPASDTQAAFEGDMIHRQSMQVYANNSGGEIRMTDSKIGTIGWIDLTVDNAEEIREFYEQVTGWRGSPVAMGDYDDHCLCPPAGQDPVAGICHKRGNNSNVPSGWIIYVTVEDVDQSAKTCVRLGGKIMDGPRNYGPTGKFCIIADPSGAVSALYSDM